MMKTKVSPINSGNINHLFDPKLVKHDLNKKIHQRMSLLDNRRKLLSRQDTSSLKQRKAGVLSSNAFKVHRPSISTRENVTSTELMPSIDCAMKLQQITTEAAVTINRAYELDLLLIFLEAFLSFIFNCYFMIALLVEPEEFKLPRAESANYLLQHLFSPSLCVIVAVMGFEMVRFKLRRTQKIVNKLIIYATDNDIRTRFLAFSQQIQVNIPQFTVFGFFSLDGSVVFSMISSTTTHLIILIQTIGSPSDVDHRLSPPNVNGSAGA